MSLPESGVQLVAKDAEKFKQDMDRAKSSVMGFGKDAKGAALGAGQLNNAFQNILRGNIGGAFQSIASSMGPVGLAAVGVAGAVTAVGAAVDREIARSRVLIGTVDDLADRYDLTTFQAGALTNASKIMGVSQSVLNMAFRTMARQDLPPTLDGLLQVKRLLDAAPTPAARTALAVKLLGRSGLELNETLSLTNQELETLISRAEAATIVTGAMADEQDRLNRQLGFLNALEEQANTLRTNGLRVGKATLQELKAEIQTRLTVGSTMLLLGIRGSEAGRSLEQMGEALGFAAEMESRGLSTRGMSIDQLYRLAQATQNVGSEAHGMIREFTDGLEDIPPAVETVAAQMPRLPSIWDQVFPSPSDLAKKLQDQIDFIQAGGPGLVAAITNVQSALAEGEISPEQAEAMLEPLRVAAAGLDVELGNITLSEAAWARVEEIGGTFKDAREDIEAGVEAIDTLPQEIDIRINWIMENPIPGFQHGGSFVVGGRAGVDANLVAFRATRGERVSVSPPASVYNQQTYNNQRSIGSVNLGGGFNPRDTFAVDRMIRGWFRT